MRLNAAGFSSMAEWGAWHKGEGAAADALGEDFRFLQWRNTVFSPAIASVSAWHWDRELRVSASLSERTAARTMNSLVTK
jgi:hypothetical protein